MKTSNGKRPILVTGSNRSGTTWVGKMLCQSNELRYIHEPFNSSNWPRLLGIRLGGHYTYVCAENEGRYVGPVADVLRSRPRLARQALEVRGKRDVLRLGRHTVDALDGVVRRRRPLLKDPIALFSTPWLADRFNVQPVVMIRHPAAYVSSVSRLGWRFDFSYLLGQDLLMRDLLGDFRGEITAMAAKGDAATPFEQAMLLWRLKYAVVDRWREERPEWVFLRYEDLAADPLVGFEQLYGRLGLTFDARAAAGIESFTGEGNAKERPTTEAHNVKRDSRAARWAWLKRLSADEIGRIREGVGAISDRFYTGEEWSPA
jgi:hypothetical protein